MRGIFGWSAIVIATVSVSARGAWAADDASFALYSNMHPESGDVLGTRIALMRLADGTYAFYEESEGWPEKGEVVKLDPDLLKKSRLDFSIMEGGRSFAITGRATQTAIFLTSGGYRLDDKVLRIGRVTLPEKIPLCR